MPTIKAWLDLRLTFCLAILFALGGSLQMPASADEAAGSVRTLHGFALHGEPKYGPEATHTDFVNPNAPKGGTVRQWFLGSTYDSFNSFIVRGSPVLYNTTFSRTSHTIETLMAWGMDEAASQYGLIAETITVPEDWSWAEYQIREEARWHDGQPITAEDVAFSVEKLRLPIAQPSLRKNVQHIESVEILGPRRVRFNMDTKNNKRAVFEAGLTPILAKHFWEDKDFSKPMITPILLSGPYKYGEYELGRSLELVRVEDYWGKDIFLNKGRFNYDRMIRDHATRDSTVAFEGFKSGAYDYWTEQSHKNWAVGYDFPAYLDGRVKREYQDTGTGGRYQAFYFNLRNPKFQDPKLREALQYAFDFPWMNKNLFYGQYQRTRSLFGPTELAATGLPSEAEIALLEPFRDQIPARIYTEEFNPPETDGTQESLRENLRRAAQILLDAGYEMRKGKLFPPGSDQPLSFEVMMYYAHFEPLVMSWAENLRLLGIEVRPRKVDLSQYTKKMENYDFEVVSTLFLMPRVPGTEQRTYWGSQYADAPGSFNYTGLKDPAVDYLIDAMIGAKTREELLTAAHAFDRVMTWNFYTVPHYNDAGQNRVAYWDRFGRPEGVVTNFVAPHSSIWWIDPEKDAELNALRLASQ